jgi:hypothetical protein
VVSRARTEDNEMTPRILSLLCDVESASLADDSSKARERTDDTEENSGGDSGKLSPRHPDFPALFFVADRGAKLVNLHIRLTAQRRPVPQG